MLEIEKKYHHDLINTANKLDLFVKYLLFTKIEIKINWTYNQPFKLPYHKVLNQSFQETSNTLLILIFNYITSNTLLILIFNNNLVGPPII